MVITAGAAAPPEDALTLPDGRTSKVTLEAVNGKYRALLGCETSMVHVPGPTIVTSNGAF